MGKSQRKSGAILSYIQIFLTNTIALIYTPFAIRMLGQSQYGLFGTASSFTSYLSLLGLGIGGAYIRWNARYRAENDVEGERRLNGMYFTMFSIIAFITLIVGVVLLFVSDYIFGNSFSEKELTDLKYIIFLNVINSALTLFMTPIFANIQAYERFLVLRIVPIISAVITPVGNIIILLLGGKAVLLTFFTVVLSTINLIVYFLYARKRLKMRFIFKGFEWKVFKGIFAFSAFLFLNTITDLLTDNTDNIILGAVSGTVAVAIYTVGHNFKNYFLQFSTAVSGVFAPQVNQIVAKNDNNHVLSELMLRVGRVQFYIVSLVMIGYIAVGRSFIALWAGENYTDAFLIGFFLLAGAYVPLFQNVGIEIQKAKNKHKVRSVVYLLVAIFNIGMTIPFSILWGGVGAALATFICCMIGNVIFMNIYYHKGIGLDMISFWKSILRIIPSFIPTIVVCVLINMFLPVEKLMFLLLSIVIICFVYFISEYFFAFNKYEKELVLGPVKRLVKKISSNQKN